LAMEMKVEDDGAVGPSWLGCYKHQTASPRPTANTTHATRVSLAPAYDTRAGARNKCACIFLVMIYPQQWNWICPLVSKVINAHVRANMRGVVISAASSNHKNTADALWGSLDTDWGSKSRCLSMEVNK